MGLLHSASLKKYNENANEQLLDEIDEVKSKLKYAQGHFAEITDDDLIEANSYEIKSLNARYRYLLKEAKRVGATKDLSAAIQEVDL